MPTSAPAGPGNSLTQRLATAAHEVVKNVSGEDDGATTGGDGLTSEVNAKTARRSAVRGMVARLVLLVVVLVGLGLAAEFLGVVEYVKSGELKHYMVEAGNTGLVVFIALYCIGVVAHIPGLVFVAAAVLAYGPVKGAIVAFLGGIPAVAITFLVVRAIGGTALAHVNQPYMRRVLNHLDERPIWGVILLRTVFIMAPGVNYGLALSSVKFRDYVLGSIIGLIIPIAVAATIIDYFWS